MRLEFSVAGLPVAQPRPKARAFGGHAQVYNPKTADAWKACVISQARAAMQAAGITQPMQGPIVLGLHFTLPRPKAHYRTGKHAGELRGDAPEEHAQRPDWDNLAKAVCDGLTSAGVWLDDSQIWRVGTTKTFGSVGSASVLVEGDK